MTVSPRTVRTTIALPSAPRLRRVVGVNTRPLGRFSVFLAAAGILGLTALCYLWQDSHAVAASLRIPALNRQLTDAVNQRVYLQGQINILKSPAVVMLAARKYGLSQPSQDTAPPQQVDVAGPLRTQVLVVYRAAAGTRAAAPVHLSTTNVTTASWWQNLWVALYNVMH